MDSEMNSSATPPAKNGSSQRFTREIRPHNPHNLASQNLGPESHMVAQSNNEKAEEKNQQEPAIKERHTLAPAVAES
jgi:hypothetical protein